MPAGGRPSFAALARWTHWSVLLCVAASVQPTASTEPEPIPIASAAISVAPAECDPGEALWVTITGYGTNFVQGTESTSVRLEQGTSTIEAHVLNVLSHSQLFAHFLVPDTAEGFWDVVVESPDGEVVRAAGAFVVGLALILPEIPPQPSIAVTPTEAEPGDHLAVTITGQGTQFAQGTETTTVRFVQGSPTTATIVPEYVRVLSATRLQAGLRIPEAALYGWDVVVESPDGEVVRAAGAFVVHEIPPSIEVSPAKATPGEQLEVTITGQRTHFAQGTVTTSVRLVQGDRQLEPDFVIVNSATWLLARFGIPDDARNRWDVVVESPDDGAVRLPEGFRITLPPSPPRPEMAVMPSWAAPGEPLTVTLAGVRMHFAQASTSVRFEQGTATIQPSRVEVVDATWLRAWLEVPADAEGAWDAVVETPEDSVLRVPAGLAVQGDAPTGCGDCSFTIEPSAVETGHVASVSVRGFGTRFQQKFTRIHLQRDAAAIYPDQIRVTRGDRMKADFSIPPEAALGAWDVVIVSPQDGVLEVAEGLAMVPAAVVSPSQAKQREQVTLTIATQGASVFTDGARVRLEQGGVAIEALQVDVVDAGSLSAVFAIPANALGRWDVVVDVPSGQVLRWANRFEALVVSETFQFTVSDGECDGYPCSTLRAGFAGGASDGIDPLLGEVEIPPLPPPGAVEARLMVPGRNGTNLDLRSFPTPEVRSVTYTVHVQGYFTYYNNNSYNRYVIAWDPASLPGPGRWSLEDPFGGIFFRVDMNDDADGRYEITNPALTEVLLVYRPLAYVSAGIGTCSYDLPAGWSLVSLCGVPTIGDASLATHFPGAISLFRFTDRYEQTTGLVVGAGYWIHLDNPRTYEIDVEPATHVIHELSPGWNLVGGPHGEVGLAALQAELPGLVSLFGFDGLYIQATAMVSGAAYWINVTEPTQVLLAASPAKPVATSPLPSPDGRLWLASGGRRAELALGVEPAAVVALPPLPPAGVFDARVMVADGVGARQVPAAGGEYDLVVQGADLSVGWEMQGEQDGRWELVVGDRRVPLAGRSQLQLGPGPEPPGLVLRRLGPLPARFDLAQNYPNPFNAGTVLAYDLSEPGPVCLAVYDVAGQLVRLLVTGQLPPGHHEARWDGRDGVGVPVASGIYLYELRAGGFRSVRKMVLLQ